MDLFRNHWPKIISANLLKGPAMVYMSRAPGDNVRAYDGSGDWFKIFQEGVCNNGDFTGPAWCTWDRNWIGARIPTGTPNGEYLIRVEHIGKLHYGLVNQTPQALVLHIKDHVFSMCEHYLTARLQVSTAPMLTSQSTTSPACKSGSPVAATEPQGQW